MKADDSFLEIFQDPLLTIIAIILINTTWVFIPGEDELIDSDSLVTADEMFLLKKYVRAVEDKTNQLEMEIQHKKKELDWLKEKIREEKEISQETGEDAEKIKQKIEELEKEIVKKRDELKQLEDAIEKAKVELTSAEEKEDIEEILNKIQGLEREIERKRSELRVLDHQIMNAKRNMVNSKERADKQKRLVAQLQNKLKALLEEIKKLEAEIPKRRAAKGFKPYFESNKKNFYIELVNNRLFPVDEEHYDEYIYFNSITYIIMTRKTSVSGEDINKIENTGSKFHKTLEKLNPEQERIIFLVHGDSFEIYWKARTIALENGIEIGWVPHEEDSITFTPLVGDGNKIGSIRGTSPPR